MAFKEKLTEKSGLPKEIVLDYPKITIIGQSQLDVENYKGIIEYSETQIRLNTYLYILIIKGEDLSFEHITSSFVSVRGKITDVIMQ